jgi:hypothetical protein
MSTIITQQYRTLEVSKSEIFRYAGAPMPDVDTRALREECLAELGGRLSYKVCYRELDVKIDGTCVEFGSFKANSAALAKNLSGCKKVIVFAATIGVEIDRLISRYARISPRKALMMQAVGTERIEALCDRFFEDLKTEYGRIKPRFSPGYADLSLNTQRYIFSLLDCPRRIGIFLNQSLLMSPSKSVTAFVGIVDKGVSV